MLELILSLAVFSISVSLVIAHVKINRLSKRVDELSGEPFWRRLP